MMHNFIYFTFIVKITPKTLLRKGIEACYPDLTTTTYKWVIISCFILVLAIVISASISTQYRAKRKKRLLKKKALNPANERELLLLKNLLVQRFGIVKKLTLINSMPNVKEQQFMPKINEIIYGDSEKSYNWEEFYILLNEIHCNLSIKLTEIFPELNSDENHLCCLIKAGFNTGDICFILNLAPITIRMKKTAIRKKINIKNGRDLKDFLDEFVEKLHDINNTPQILR